MRTFTTTVLIALLSVLGAFIHMELKPQNKPKLSFGENLNRIAKKINSDPSSTWTAHEDGRFSELTKEETLKRLGHLTMPRPAEIELIEDVQNNFNGAIPTSFDSRANWPKCESIQEIRDQSACGSCWAFATVETISDRICIASKQKLQTRISSADLMSCCASCGDGCDGGYNYMAFVHWRYNGIVTGDLYKDDSYCKPYPFKCNLSHGPQTPGLPKCPKKEYPTPACKRQCNPSYSKSYNCDKHYAKHVYATKGAKNIAKEIANNGPVATGFTVYEDFMAYKGGIYQHKTGDELGGHSVKIVGYGEEKGVKYWIVANSWDYDWGEKGFFRIIRGINDCGFEDQVVAGFPKL